MCDQLLHIGGENGQMSASYHRNFTNLANFVMQKHRFVIRVWNGRDAIVRVLQPVGMLEQVSATECSGDAYSEAVIF